MEIVVGPMARKIRLEYAGAIYHVMNRGDRREAIFKDDKDRECFLETLGECCVKTVNVNGSVHTIDNNGGYR